MKDYYKILEINEDSSQSDIKKQFRYLAKKYHPDKNKGDAESERKFKEISEAYETLSVERKRKIYDFHKKNGPGGNPFGGRFSPFGGGFGRGFGRGEDEPLTVRMDVSLEMAFLGVVKNIKYETMQSCGGCLGLGSSTPERKTICPVCLGSGRIKLNLSMLISSGHTQCGNCGGEGECFETPCVLCNGAKKTRQVKTLKVKIPKGVRNGSRIVMEHEGSQKSDGSKGDLHLFINLYGDGFYELRGNNTYSSVPIPLHIFLCGGKIEIPTLHGKHISTIKKQQKKIKLKNKGFPDMRSGECGHHYVSIVPEIPKEMPDEVLKSLEELEINKHTYPEYIKMSDER